MTVQCLPAHNKCRQIQECVRGAESGRGCDRGRGEACRTITFERFPLCVDGSSVLGGKGQVQCAAGASGSGVHKG